MKTIMKSTQYMLISLLFISILFSSSALAVPNDFDADGSADMSIARVDGNTTTWTTQRTSNFSRVTWTFDQPADAFVTGRYFNGDPRYYPGIVRVTSANENLLWTVKNSEGQDVSFRFGNPGDTITNLGDWNCDGVDDPHVVRQEADGGLSWFVSVSNGTVEQYRFGLNGDRGGLAKAANGCVQALVLLRMEGNEFRWFFKGLGQGLNDPNQFQTIKWGLTGDIPLIPTDLDGDNLLDFVVTRPVGDFQEGYIRFGNGGFVPLVLGFDDSIPQIGYYDGTPLFAWSQRDNGGAAIRHSNGFLNIFNFGDAQSSIIRADGSVVAPTTNARFGTSSMTDGSTSVSVGNGTCPNGGGTGSGNPPCSSLAFNDGRGGDLWIYESESDGRPVYLLNSGFRSAPVVDVVRTDGTCERARFTGFANPDPGGQRPHYRFDRDCTQYTGQIFVQDGVQTCEVNLPRDPCVRID